MTDPRRKEELIQKHFDELLTGEEVAELDALIKSDPDVAREFNRLARMDSFIYSHFNKCRAEETVRIEIEHEARAAGIALQPDWLKPSRPAPAPRWHWNRFLEHLWGPTGAVILHILVVLVLLRFAVYEIERREEKEFPVAFDTETDFKTDPLPPPIEGDPQPVAPVPVPVVGPTTIEADPITSLLDPTTEGPDPSVLGVDPTLSKVTLKGLYVDRGDARRKEALGTYNTVWGVKTESAVLRALEWLKKHQGQDGSWGPNKIAMTGLALLTFLAHGETTASTNYGHTVEIALRHLMDRQDADGYLSRSREENDGADPTAYAHAIGTYALCEAYGLMRIPSLRPAMEKAVQVILDGQQPKGGWNYRFAKSLRRDTSVSGWMVQALKSAQIAGAQNPGLKEALDRALDDLRSVQNPETARFGYTDSGGGSLGCTGIGVLCLQLLGHGRGKEARRGLMVLRDASVKWRPEQEDGWPLYEWYYITQAKFHHGGDVFKQWNTEFAREYTRRQNEDGSWPPASKPESRHGAVYSTTFAALALEVYYRFLPTFQTNAVAPAAVEEPDETTVEVL